jgi:hypothetical protein
MSSDMTQMNIAADIVAAWNDFVTGARKAGRNCSQGINKKHNRKINVKII